MLRFLSSALGRCIFRFLTALPAIWLCILPAGAADAVYTFSVVPQFERRTLFNIWQPIVDEIQRQTGQRFELVTSLSVGDYDAEVRRGAYDFVYLNPYLMDSVAKQPGYIPLVHDGRPLHGIVIVRKDSPLLRAEDLQNKTLAVPALPALAASLLVRAELDRKHATRVSPVVVKTHSSVFMHVVNGLTDAGGTTEKLLLEQDPRIQGTLRVLFRTQGVPSHPIAAHQRVPAAVREQVKQAFRRMGDSPQGRELLARIPMQEVKPVAIQEFQSIKELKLEHYLEQ